MEARNEMSLDKQTPTLPYRSPKEWGEFGYQQIKNLLSRKDLASELFDEPVIVKTVIKGIVEDAVETASRPIPTTRTQGARQPKPNPIPFDAEFMMGFDMGKDGGDESSLSIGYAAGGKLHVCALVEGEDAEKLYAALSQLKPQSDALREAVKDVLEWDGGLHSIGYDGTKAVKARDFLKEWLADAEVERILAASDDEILAEFREKHGDPEAYAAKMRKFVSDYRTRQAPVPTTNGGKAHE